MEKEKEVLAKPNTKFIWLCKNAIGLWATLDVWELRLRKKTISFDRFQLEYLMQLLETYSL